MMVFRMTMKMAVLSMLVLMRMMPMMLLMMEAGWRVAAGCLGLNIGQTTAARVAKCTNKITKFVHSIFFQHFFKYLLTSFLFQLEKKTSTFSPFFYIFFGFMSWLMHLLSFASLFPTDLYL